MKRYDKMSRKDRIEDSDKVAIMQLERELRQGIKQAKLDLSKIVGDQVPENYITQWIMERTDLVEKAVEYILKKWKVSEVV